MQVIEFKTEYPLNREPVDWVLIAPTGSNHTKTQTWHRVKKLIPPEGVDRKTTQSAHYQAMIARWEQLEPKYNAWKQGQELPEDGTPLEAWSAMTPEKAATLKGMGIRTIEAVSEMGDKEVSMCRWPDARKMPELAKKFLDGRDMAARDEENERLKERLAAMEEMLEAQQPKPKRGRPPKKESEAA